MPKHVQNFLHILLVDVFRQFIATQQQIKQVIVRQVHQHIQGTCLSNRSARVVPIEEALYEQVILQQATPAAPAQLAEATLPQRGRGIKFMEQLVAHHRCIRRRDAPSVP